MNRDREMDAQTGRATRAPDAGQSGPAGRRARWDVAIALTGALAAWLGLALVWPWLVLEPTQAGGLAGRPPWYLLAPAMLAHLFPAGWAGLALLAGALAGLPLLRGGEQTRRANLRRGVILGGASLALLLTLAGWWRTW